MAAGDVEVSIARPDARQCAKFDGVDDMVDFGNPSILNIVSEISISAWVYKTSNKNYQRVITKGVHPTNSYMILADTSGKFYFNIIIEGAEKGSVLSEVIPLNEWHQFIGTYDGTKIRFYVDGVECSTGISQTGTLTQVSGSVKLANDGGTTFSEIKLNDVRIYNRAISNAEVAKLYGGIHITDGLVGYWPLKTDYLDYSGNGNNGTNTGSVLVTSDGPIAKAIADKRVNSSDRYFAIDVNGGSQIVAGRIQEA